MTRLFAFFVLMISLVAASSGAGTLTAPKSPVGTWTGKLAVKFSASAQSSLTPAQKQQQADMIKKLVFTLTIKKDKTYTIMVGSGAPPSNGKWVQKGNKITLTSDKASGPSKSQVATLSANGKKMTIPLPPNPQATGTITFTR